MNAEKRSAAFMHWYAPHHERFTRYCYGRALGMEDAKDLLQDAVLSALEQWERLQQKDRLLGYMIGIVNNRVRNQLRGRATHDRFVEQRRRALSDRLPNNPEAALDLHYLLKAMDELPELGREALLLTAVSGFSIREVAELQQSTQTAVKTRISRARQRLRDTFAENGRRLSLAERLRIYTSILL